MEIKEITNKEALKLLNSKKDNEENSIYTPLGKFYFYEKHNDKYIAIDNETGEAWTEEFNYKENAIAYLNNEDVEECYHCHNDYIPVVSICIEFKDGYTYTDLVDLNNDSNEIDQYIKELIKENKWNNDDIKKTSYGLFCPYCLWSVD